MALPMISGELKTIVAAGGLADRVEFPY
jgi:hypothetical protein